MATLLYRLGKTAFRRWPLFIAGWLVVLLGLGFTASAIARPMVDTFSIPGIDSLKAQDLETELFPDTEDAFAKPTVNVVVAAPEGEKLSDPANAEAIATLIKQLGQLPQLPADLELVSPVDAAAGLRQQLEEAGAQSQTPPEVIDGNVAAISPLSEDGRIGILNFTWDAKTLSDVEPESQQALKDLMDSAQRETGLSIEANGQGMATMEVGSGASELLGIAIAGLVLLITFGSLVAAGLPLLTAITGVAVGMMGISISTAFADVGTTTPVLATMLGLAVGIDYTLFILSRYRTELHHTDDREEAVGRAVGTAGSAVVFAGLTVLIALSALRLVGIPFLTAMGMAAALTVLVAVLVALTLLPAILGLLKSKAFAGRVRRDTVKRDSEGRVHNNGVRWARFIARRPVAVLLVGVVVLLGLAYPVTQLRLALPSDSTAGIDTTQRKASDLISAGFGPGREAPLLVVVDARDITGESDAAAATARQQAFGEIVQWAGDDRDVVNAQIVRVNEAGDGATVLVTPAGGPDDASTTDLLHRLRDELDEQQKATGTTLGVTGLTAIQVDVSERLTQALPVYLAVVIGLAFVLLMVVFRSVLVPLTATLGFLLSVLATLGATVAVFQNGDLGIVEGTPLVSFMPIILIGIVFGLAMDYQVFLVSRMREMYTHGDTAHEAVEDGFRHGARVVSAAAAIMIAVFAAFMLQDDKMIQSIGFALAIAIVFDAFVVRMTLIPAVMYLLGDKAWWLPRWLDRLLPTIDVEGTGLRPESDWEDELGHRGEHVAGSRA